MRNTASLDVRLLTVTGILLMAGAMWAQEPAAHSHDSPKGDKVRLQGELMDLTCYLQHPATGQGPEHAACARKCILEGLPPGLRTEGKLYLLLGPGHTNVRKKAGEYAGQNVVVEGHVVSSGGLEAVVVTSLAPAKGAPHSKAAGPEGRQEHPAHDHGAHGH